MAIDGISAGAALTALGREPVTAAGTGAPAPVVQSAETFAELLNRALSAVNDAQREADAAAIAFATGENRDVAALMMATEQAHLALDLTIQVRNKVLEAYQEIVRMQL